MCVVLSPELLSSDWCKLEFTSVLSEDPTNRLGRLIPLRLRDHHKTSGERLRMPPILSSLNYLDVREPKNFERHFARLLAKLRGEAPPRGRPGRSQSRDRRPEAVVAALPQRREEPDQVPETLLSNLLPIRSLPTSIWSAPSSVSSKRELPEGQRFPPCVIRDGRVFTFTDLSRSASVFAGVVRGPSHKQEALVDWRNDADRWHWVIDLFNQCLRDHLWPKIGFDREHRRFYFRPHGAKSVCVRWGSGTKRTVVRAPDAGKGGYWVHQAARLRFETLGTRLYLSVEPSWMFTTDGHTPLPRGTVGPLAMQWGGKERNGTILRHVLMWSDALTKGRKDAIIAAGDQQLVIGRLPATVQAPVSLVDDRVNVRALLEFSRVELDLDPGSEEFAFVDEEPDPTKSGGTPQGTVSGP